ncbi:hypothetical protein OSH11_10480 [Kaistia dalseonensis]|uniref:Uncharacterized protein n=1 Tax=Kaistia dalseonensis TaxID=410840 RepID=A0ABU0H886_9HYPH|nr:hypothetical protein [Kaistia dalseonensis]MCX5495132.1 hypothetical protein [Kaistia dalseonensis]MDQ0437714.1 hypothetical protein [Kaistia dalseonensis]
MTNDTFHRASPRRETAARRLFYVWMAAYAAVIVAIAVVHTFGGIAGGTVIDADGIRTQQAKMTGEPQSSLADRMLPRITLVDVNG